MTTIYLLRHAEKLWGGYFNERLRHQDEPLSPIGLQTADRLVATFADKPIAAIYISEYQRTRQTITPTAQRLNLTPSVDARLNEIDSGLLEGMSDQAIQQAYPEVWRAYIERQSDFRFPEGETGAEAERRIVSFLEEKRVQHANEHIIAVCHEGLVRLTACTILGLPVYKRGNFRVDFGGLMEITYQPDYEAWKLIRFNQAWV